MDYVDVKSALAPAGVKLCAAPGSKGAVDDENKAQTSKPWESVRLVCRDGAVPASLELLSMMSPVLRKQMPSVLSDNARMPLNDQPIEVKVPESTVAEWQELLKHVSPVFPRPTLTPEIMHKLLPLAHKMGMTDFLGHCDLKLERQLPEQLTMSPATSPAYLMKWLAAADQFNLVKTRAVCLDSIRVGKGRLAGLTKQDQLQAVGIGRHLYRYSWAPDSFYRQFECSSDQLMLDMQQLSPATLAMMFMIMHGAGSGIYDHQDLGGSMEQSVRQLFNKVWESLKRRFSKNHEMFKSWPSVHSVMRSPMFWMLVLVLVLLPVVVMGGKLGMPWAILHIASPCT